MTESSTLVLLKRPDSVTICGTTQCVHVNVFEITAFPNDVVAPSVPEELVNVTL